MSETFYAVGHRLPRTGEWCFGVERCPYCGENAWSIDGEADILYCGPCGQMMVGYDGDTFRGDSDAMYAEAERRIAAMWATKRIKELEAAK